MLFHGHRIATIRTIRVREYPCPQSGIVPPGTQSQLSPRCHRPCRRHRLQGKCATKTSKQLYIFILRVTFSCCAIPRRRFCMCVCFLCLSPLLAFSPLAVNPTQYASRAFYSNFTCKRYANMEIENRASVVFTS